MQPTLQDILDAAESLWPIEGAEGWDSSGLVSGSATASVSAIHLAVDAVQATADEALAVGAQIFLTHHPLLLRGVTTVAEDRYKGSVLATLIRGGCALLSAHTNADVVDTGTSATLAAALSLDRVTPIVASAIGETTGIGRVGDLPKPITLGALSRRIAEILPATPSGVRASGDYDRIVSRVAVCAGAGDTFLGDAAVLDSDVFVTSDLRHHPASEFRENARIASGPALIDVSHWAAEWLWLDIAADQLRSLFPTLAVTVSELRTDPWDFVVVQENHDER